MASQDISHEAEREYYWADGFIHRILKPAELQVIYLNDQEIHRIKTVTGISHQINPGWRSMIARPWVQKEQLNA